MQLVATRRPKPEQQRSWRGAWRPRSITQLRTASQLAREAERQKLLTERWRRWQSMIVTVRGLVVTVVLFVGVMT